VLAALLFVVGGAAGYLLVRASGAGASTSSGASSTHLTSR
jgi:hypothetical protein